MIKVQNIYYMLAYAFQNLNEEEASKYSSEEFEFAADLFAVILAKGIRKQIKRGIGREYVHAIRNCNLPKGKVLLSETIKNRATLSKKVTCAVNNLTEDNYLNQVLKSTAFYLLGSSDVTTEHKRALRKTLVYFSSVKVIDCKSINWASIRYNRINSSYRMLINICYLVIKGMLMSDTKGDYKLSRYVDDQQMYTLFEKFILEYYRKHFPMFSVNASKIAWNTDDGVIQLLPAMKSDVTIEYKGKTLIIDAKFYASSLQVNPLYGNKTIHSNNLYQIFTYVKNKDHDKTGEVSGLLLYANTEGDNPNMTYKFSGNRISVKTLDLNCDFSKVQQQLNAIIVDWLEESKISIT